MKTLIFISMIILGYMAGMAIEWLTRQQPTAKPHLIEKPQIIEESAEEDNTETFIEELQIARQTIQDQEQIIHYLSDELDFQNTQRAVISKQIGQSKLEFQIRIKPSLAQINQIKSFLMSQDKLPEKEDFYSYLQAQVFTPAQHKEYVEYEKDLEYSERLKTLSELVRIIKIPDDTLDEFYNHEFSTNEEALAAILSEDQLKLWEEYNK